MFRLFAFSFVILFFISGSFCQSDTSLINKRIDEIRPLSYSDPLLALQKTDSLMGVCASLSYQKGLAELNNLQGIILFNRGLNDMALRSFISALEYFNQLDDSIGQSKIYNNLGVVSFSIKKYHYSIFFFQQALLIQKKTGNMRNIIDLYNNIGSLYEKLKMYDKALVIHRRSNVLSIRHNHITGLSTGYNNLGVIYENTNRPDSAIHYYLLSIETGDSVAASQLALVYSNVARTLMNIGKMNEAAQYLDSALALSVRSDALVVLSEVYNLKSKYFESSGDYKLAYQYLRDFKVLQDKMDEQTTEGDFADFILSIQQSKWLKEKELLDREVTLQRKVKLLLFVLIAIGAFVFVLLYLTIRNRNKLLGERHRLAESEKMRLAEELNSRETISKLQTEKLTQEIQLKERQLTSMTMHIVTKNETLQEIGKYVEQLAGLKNQSATAEIEKIRGVIRMNASDEAVWSNYFYHFEQVYPGFFSKLADQHPDLTQGEQKLCAYITINLSNKEIAHVMGISEASIKIKKNRLSKKLNLDMASDLTHYLRRFTLQGADQS